VQQQEIKQEQQQEQQQVQQQNQQQNMQEEQRRLEQEKERLEKEKQELEELLQNEKLERERLQNDKLEKEQLERREKERLEKERLDKEQLEKERLDKEQREKLQLEKERLEKEKLEKERLEKEQLEKEQLEKEKLEKEKLEKERLEQEKLKEAKIKLPYTAEGIEEILDGISRVQRQQITTTYTIDKRFISMQNRLDKYGQNWQNAINKLDSGIASFEKGDSIGDQTFNEMKTTLSSINNINDLITKLEGKVWSTVASTHTLQKKQEAQSQELAEIVENTGGWGIWVYLLIVQILIGALYIWYRKREDDKSYKIL